MFIEQHLVLANDNYTLIPMVNIPISICKFKGFPVKDAFVRVFNAVGRPIINPGSKDLRVKLKCMVLREQSDQL